MEDRVYQETSALVRSPPTTQDEQRDSSSSSDAFLLPDDPNQKEMVRLRRKRRHEKRREEAGYLFKYIMFCQAVLYIEAGAIPCILDQLSTNANMSAAQQGALGGIVYLALSAASPLAGYLFRAFDVKLVIAASLLANNFCVLAFALTPMGLSYSGSLLVLSRALIGFTQACICVYSPLWVDEYAPQSKVAGWMSYLQGATPLGIMFGYMLGAFSNGFSDGGCYFFLCWRIPFLVQFLVVCPLMVGIFFVPSKHMTMDGYNRETPSNKEHRTSEEVVMPRGHANNPPAHANKPRGHARSKSVMAYPQNQAAPHPHVVLDENAHLRRTFTGYNVFEEKLNIPQLTSVSASYMVPRPRLDSLLFADSSSPDTLNFGALPSYGTTIEEAVIDDDTHSVISEMEGQSQKSYSFLEEFMILMRIPVYVNIVLSLTSVYFVVTGVQYWGTIFMIKSLHGSRYLVNVLFVVVAGTGPIMGVFFGGWAVDRLGGYKGPIQRAIALKACTVLGAFAAILAIATTFLYNLYVVAIFLWMLLFFGGSIVPPCTGMFISVVPKAHRALASSVSIMVFNLLGYALSPYLTGVVMSTVLNDYNVPGSWFEHCDEACAYRLGLRFCLAWCLWSLVSISFAWAFAERDAEIARMKQKLLGNRY